MRNSSSPESPVLQQNTSDVACGQFVTVDLEGDGDLSSAIAHTTLEDVREGTVSYRLVRVVPVVTRNPIQKTLACG